MDFFKNRALSILYLYEHSWTFCEIFKDGLTDGVTYGCTRAITMDTGNAKVQMIFPTYSKTYQQIDLRLLRNPQVNLGSKFKKTNIILRVFGIFTHTFYYLQA